jgi:hypothetical protein
MANQDIPSGFKPVRGIGGSASIKTGVYKVSDSYTTRIPKYALVKLVGGYAQALHAAQASSSNLLGSAQEFVSSSGTGRTVTVAHDPAQVFEAQMDDNTLQNEQSLVGNNFGITNLTAANVVSTYEVISKQEIDGSSHGAWAAGKPLQCVKMGDGIENVAAGSWTRLQVKIAPQSHALGQSKPQDLAG